MFVLHPSVSAWCPTPVGTGTPSRHRPDTRGYQGHGKKQAASRSHTAARERCSFQRGNAVMEKWLCGPHIAPTHKAAVDGCQLVQTTLTPPGWGQLDEMPHQTLAPSQGQRLPGQFVTLALLPRMLCRVWFVENSSCKMLRNGHGSPHSTCPPCLP